MGEGESMGPLNPQMKKDMLSQQGDLRYDVPWTMIDSDAASMAPEGPFLKTNPHPRASTGAAQYAPATTAT